MLAGALLAGLLVPVSQPADAAIAPPWCGTPSADAAAALPTGANAGDPAGSFPHIPYYAVGCTLERIQGESNGRMSLEVIGESALGRPMYGVVINALETKQQRDDYRAWTKVRKEMLEDPAKAQSLVDAAGSRIKTPMVVQGGIHGNEFEGVDAAMELIEKYATTPYGVDPEVDYALDHLVLVFNPIQNPDGRVSGQRLNGNGFDLNRDYLSQTQTETIASINLQKEWLAPELLDLHGYVAPTLIEGTTKPHNPSVEYDLWIKWNQPRVAANVAAMDAAGFETTIPVTEWCSDGDFPTAPSGLCDNGRPPGPAEAEGWDDWGPFYTGMYAQQIGLDASTVEMCWTPFDICGGRVGAKDQQVVVVESTMDFVADNRSAMLHDQLEILKRNDVNAPRPACCPAPYDVDNNWMNEYGEGYVIPMGTGQRSEAEANRLVEWLLYNDIEVQKTTQPYTYGGTTYAPGSYLVPMAQPRRGLADTALSVGVDISDRINQLYAPPAAWSHGYLWGADVVPVARGAALPAKVNKVRGPSLLGGGVQGGSADYYALEIDSPTAVRFLNGLVADGGLQPKLALGPVQATTGTLAAGSVVLPAGRQARRALDALAKRTGLEFQPVKAAGVPALEAIDRVPRIAVLAGSLDQSVWSLRDLGFPANPVSTAMLNGATNPLDSYDVIFNAGTGYPANTAANATARARLAAFFAAGGGYIGAGTTGAGFLTNGGQVTGLTAAARTGGGRSGIVWWDNTGGTSSVITGAYPARDTAIMDPPTWLTAVPSTFTVDARLPQSGFFAAGLWRLDEQSASAPGSALVAHGTNTTGTARMTVFAMNPLYRADPEREWPMVSAAAYWADK
nr:M14 family zinc carboxypeptidase [Motilibacter deserti]